MSKKTETKIDVNILPVLLCGGSGSRLWPLSTKDRPKQFLGLNGQSPLLIETAKRVIGSNFYSPLIICNKDYQFSIQQLFQDYEIPYRDVLVEPEQKNTAASVMAAALYAENQIKSLKLSSEVKLLILPTDQVITPSHQFQQVIQKAANQTQQEVVITFGVEPTEPATEYGYIEKRNTNNGLNNIIPIKSFTEKPCKAKAVHYYETGNYYWNSGIFLASPQAILNEAKVHALNILNPVKNAFSKQHKEQEFIFLDSESFSSIKNQSFDHAIMEKTKNAYVMPAKFQWCDVGSWKALWQISDKDEEGTVTQGNIKSNNTKNSYLHNETDRTIIVNELENIVVIASSDAIIITDANKTKNLKPLFDEQNGSNKTHGSKSD